MLYVGRGLLCETECWSLKVKKLAAKSRVDRRQEIVKLLTKWRQVGI